jgi:hypothetical protein
VLGLLHVEQFVGCWRVKALVSAFIIPFEFSKFRPTPAIWNICEKRNRATSTANSLAPLIDLMEKGNGRSLVIAVMPKAITAGIRARFGLMKEFLTEDLTLLVRKSSILMTFPPLW